MKEKGNLVFNVWCGYPGARIRAFLMTATVKTNGAPVDAIMNYLQKSDEFSEMSREFIAHFSKINWGACRTMVRQAPFNWLARRKAYARRSAAAIPTAMPLTSTPSSAGIRRYFRPSMIRVSTI